MSLQEELLAIERGFWTAGEGYFLEHVDERCLLAFPQMPEMHGIHAGADVAATATDPDRWRDLEISNPQLVPLGGGAAILSYRADVRRGSGEPYAALVSSAYLLRRDGWKLAFHQHSPIAEEATS